MSSTRVIHVAVVFTKSRLGILTCFETWTWKCKSLASCHTVVVKKFRETWTETAIVIVIT